MKMINNNAWHTIVKMPPEHAGEAENTEKGQEQLVLAKDIIHII